ncbi:MULTISPECIES: AAA family ATPase [unclassified Solwaraspora]|uniref:AAA family ATPase n=1 Tax=unclassified Solwaraspora TaxID=2627926 RepID=UPI00259B351B|nr:ATP-binding protein [Solwaraspora sp. WMMA2056]WJK39510.1 ATP-binding protein [Solwaraspora sp. WMMA2056]
MLIRFEAANFRSILGPVELSMVAVDRDRPAVQRVDSIDESLLPVAAIYGPNASGKSNVVAALTWLRDAVADSLRFWDDGIPVEPFAFGHGPRSPSEFTVELILGGVRFEYVVELDADAIRYEGLFHYPERKRRRIFEREGDELTLQRGLGHLSGTRELLTSRTLALSAARRFREPLVSGPAEELLSVQTLEPGPRRRPFVRQAPHLATRHWFEDAAGARQEVLPGLEDLRPDRAQALALLRMADLGIEDVVIDDGAAASGQDPRSSTRRRRIRLLHRTGDEAVPLDFGAESEGTRTWFQLIGPVLTALKAGSLLLFDELDASLHPTLSMQLIRLFTDPATNPSGAQLIFTSHDTSLLNHLNRDEVWLTEKAVDGATRLGALAEFAGERVRRSQNLEKAYLHGRFGALPDVDRTEILRALGLIG